MKRTPIRKISDKKIRQNILERKLKNQLLSERGARCEKCGRTDMVLDKHEVLHRSQCGDPLDPDNCVILCRCCHDAVHGKPWA